MRHLLFVSLIACGGGGEDFPHDGPIEALGIDQPEAAATKAEATQAEPTEAEADASAGDDAEWAAFGEPFTQDDVMGADKLLSSLPEFDGKKVRVEGRIADVCQKAGCWMVLAHEDLSIRVKMKDHAFFVDRQSTGGWADIEGEIHSKALDPAEVAHFQSEAQNPEATPELQAKDKVYDLMASAVRIRR